MKEPFSSPFAGLSTHHRAGVCRWDTGKGMCWVLVWEYLVFPMADSDMKIWLNESRMHFSVSGKNPKGNTGRYKTNHRRTCRLDRDVLQIKEIWKPELKFSLDFVLISQSLFVFLLFSVQKERRKCGSRLSHASSQAPSHVQGHRANRHMLSLPVCRMQMGPEHFPSGTGRGHWRRMKAQEGFSQPEQDVTMMGGWLEEKPSMLFQQCSVLFTGDKCRSLV